MRTVRRGRGRQEGSALIIALVFVTAISLMVAAVLSFADVGLRASKTYRERSASSYAADGAIAAAVKRYSTTGPCDTSTAPLVSGPSGDKPVNDHGVIVRCVGPPPTGSKATQPINSLLSLGTDSSDGISYCSPPTTPTPPCSSSQELRLLGDVFSNTSVTAGATMVVQGQVSALDTCSGPIQTVPSTPLRCPNTVPTALADSSRGRDPDYVPATTAVPKLRPVPPCPTVGWLVELEPGYYDDAAGLNALTNTPTGPTACNDKVVWFKPGTYYFDLGFRGGPDTWTVNNASVTVVGGMPKGPADWAPDPIPSAPRPTLSIPGSCEVDGAPGPEVPGVQIIAGGRTHLQVDKGRMELCATTPRKIDPKPQDAKQQIALFGLGPQRDYLDPHTLEGTDARVVNGFTSCTPVEASCSPAINAQTINETPIKTADAALDTSLPSASLSFDAFRPGVPRGSKIDSISLLVKHTPGPFTHTVTADFPGTTCQSTAPPAPQQLDANGRLDLGLACNLKRPQDFDALKVTYTATLTSGGAATVKVDGAVIEVAYRTPVTHRPTAVEASPGFTDPVDVPANALEIGEQPAPLTAKADLSSTNPSASITLAGLGDPPLPDNAIIDSAVLRVAHQGGGATGPPTVTVTSATGACTKPLINNLAALTDEPIDLKSPPCGIDSATKLRDLTARFDAALSTGDLGASLQLDGIWLEVVSRDGAGGAVLPPIVRRPKVATSTSFAQADQAKIDQAKFIGEVPTPLTADARLEGVTTSASLAVNDFSGLALAPGSKITSAKLRVAHQEDPNVASVGVTATVPPGPGSPGGTCTVVPPNVAALTPSYPVPLTLAAGCPLTSPDQLAGLTAAYTANRTTVTQSVSQVPSGATGDGFATPENGREIGGTPVLTANAVLPTADNKRTASVTLTGFNLNPPPPGSTIESATLRVVHQDDGADGEIAPPTVQVSFPDSTCIKTLSIMGARGEDKFENLQACGLTDPAKLATLSVLYTAGLTAAGTVASDLLDGVALDIIYRPPAVDKLDGIELDIVFEAPTLAPLCPGGTAGCDLLTVAPQSGDITTRFVAGGTIYAGPNAGVDISMDGVKDQVLKRGVIGRSIKLGLKPASSFKRPLGAIPPEIVTFTTYPDDTLTPADALPITSLFTNRDNAKAIREQPTTLLADANLDAAVPAKQTASLDLSGFTVPASGPIDGAVLHVRHQDNGNTVQVVVKGGTTSTLCFTQDLAPSPTTLRDDLIDLAQNISPTAPPECIFDTPDKLGGLTVTYAVGLASSAATATATAKLDGITLAVLSKPTVRASVTFDRAVAKVQGYSVLR